MVYRFHHVILLTLIISFGGLFMQIQAGAAASMPKVSAQTLEGHDGINLWPFFIAGAVIGGFICVGFRRFNEISEAARYFGVSSFTSILGAPWIALETRAFGTVQDVKWYTALMVAGVVAGIAWGTLEIMTLLFTSVYKACQDRGIAGLRDQIVLILSIGMIKLNKEENK